MLEAVGTRDALIREVLRAAHLPESARSMMVAMLGGIKETPGHMVRLRASARVSLPGEPARLRVEVEMDEFPAARLASKSDPEAL